MEICDTAVENIYYRTQAPRLQPKQVKIQVIRYHKLCLFFRTTMQERHGLINTTRLISVLEGGDWVEILIWLSLKPIFCHICHRERQCHPADRSLAVECCSPTYSFMYSHLTYDRGVMSEQWKRCETTGFPYGGKRKFNSFPIPFSKMICRLVKGLSVKG